MLQSGVTNEETKCSCIMSIVGPRFFGTSPILVTKSQDISASAALILLNPLSE